MQRNLRDYNADTCERYRGLVVKQPYANYLVTAAYRDDAGNVYGEKSIEVRSKNTAYRGDVLICSSVKPEVSGMECGVTLGFVELYDVKPIAEFTAEDWDKTRIPEDKRGEITKGYGWLMRNPRRVVELPTRGQLGIFSLVFDKGDIIEYPRRLVIDEKSWRLIQKQLR